MPLKLNTSDLKAYLGSQALNKIYLGNNEVYSATPALILPDSNINYLMYYKSSVLYCLTVADTTSYFEYQSDFSGAITYKLGSTLYRYTSNDDGLTWTFKDTISGSSGLTFMDTATYKSTYKDVLYKGTSNVYFAAS